MKSRITTNLFALILLVSTSLSAQTTFWSEDFADGAMNWELVNNSCGNFTGGKIGKWVLATATNGGTAIDGMSGTIHISTSRDYIAKVTMGDNSGIVQARYTEDGDTFTSELASGDVTLGSPNFGEHGDKTDWFTSVNVSSDDMASGAAAAFLLDAPTVTIDGSTLTVTSGDVVLTYAKEPGASCGSNWFWQHAGDITNGLVAPDDGLIDSPTAANGAMVFNGDWLITEGANNPGAPPYPEFNAEIISPVIDLSDVQNAVSLEWSQLVRHLNPIGAVPNTAIYVSLDGGETWGEPISANPNLAVNDAAFNGTTSLPIPGLPGQSNVRLKFVYNQDFYFWVIDDIKLIERPSYDMEAKLNFYGIMPSARTPQSMTEANIPFMADIENIGGATSTGVEYNLTITNDASGEEVFNSTEMYGDIDAEVLEENHIFPDMLDATGLEEGTYTGVYTLSMDSTDVNTDNNSISWAFAITDTVYAKDFGFTRNVTPADDNSFYYGCAYYIPETVDPSAYVTQTMTFGIANASELSGKALSTYLYKWEGDINDDGLANVAEYEQVGINSYIISGDEPDDAIITLNSDFSGDEKALEPGFHYIAMLQYVDDTGGDAPCYFLAADDLNYAAMVTATDSIEAPRYAGLLEVGATSEPDFGIVGFGYDIVPSVYLNVKQASNTQNNNILAGNVAIIAPNPVRDIANIQFQLDAQADVTLYVADATGKAVMTRNIGSQWNSTYELDVTSLTAGSYFVKIQTEDGFKTIPMIITK